MAEDEELHEISAVYDNAMGLMLGLSYGVPTFLCSCGWTDHGTDWEDVGSALDGHLWNVRRGLK